MKKLLFVLFTLLAFASCEREPALFLCDHDGTTGQERIVVDWTKFLHKETPTGMTLLLFQRTDNGYKLYSRTTTNDITHVDYDLKPGEYVDYVFNQGVDEFGSAAFSNLDDCERTAVTTTQAASQWYKDSVTTAPLVKDVEWIGTDCNNFVPLTQQMIDSANGGIITIDTLRPRNIVSTITVYVHIKNIGSLRSARSSLNGLAAGYLLGKEHPMPDKVTQLLETWHLSIDSVTTKGRQDGTIVAQISSFGLPYGHGGQPDENNLHLDCLLKNDSILSYNYHVGDKFVFDTDDNADLHFTIDITIDEPLPDVPDDEKQESGFGVDVEDWPDEQGIVINI